VYRVGGGGICIEKRDGMSKKKESERERKNEEPAWWRI
jgi:hypothetical protein